MTSHGNEFDGIVIHNVWGIIVQTVGKNNTECGFFVSSVWFL